MSQLFKLKNGTVLLSTEAPGGVYNSAQLKKIAELCSKELAVVKATEDQRLALFVKESEVAAVAEQLRGIGLGIRNYQEGLHQPLSCLGELCEEHEQPALSTAMDLTRELAKISLQSSLKIGINGCARCCTPCHTLDISILGEPGGYRVSLGGKTSQFPELSSFFAEGVPAQDLPRLIKGVVSLFKSQAEPGESLHDVLERCGVESYIKALSPYSQDAAQRDDPFAASGEEAEATAEAAPSAHSKPAADDDFSLEEPDELPLDDDEVLAGEVSTSLPASEPDDLPLAADDEIPLEDEGGIELEATDELEDPGELALEESPEMLQPDDGNLSLDDSDDISLEEAENLSLDEGELEVSSAPALAPSSKDADELSLDTYIGGEKGEDNLDDLNLEDEPSVSQSQAPLQGASSDQEISTLEEEIEIEDLAPEEDSLLEESPEPAVLAAPKTPEPIQEAIEEDLSIGELEDDLNLEPEVASQAKTAQKVEDTFTMDGPGEIELEEIPIADEGMNTLDDDLDLQESPAPQKPAATPAHTGPAVAMEEETIELEEPEDSLELEDLAYEEAPPAAPAAVAASAPIDELEEEITLEEESDLSPEEFDEAPALAPAAAPSLAEPEAEELGEVEDEFDRELADMDLEEPLDIQEESVEDQAVRALASEEGDALSFDEAELEDVPELDQELAPERLQQPQKSASPQQAQSLAGAMIPEDDFDAGLSSEGDELSDDEESSFEAKLEASIDEESRLLADHEDDQNEGDRQEALQILENPSKSKNTVPLQVIPGSKKSTVEKKSFRLAGVSFEAHSMRLKFASGAYMEIDLSQLAAYEERTFLVGEQELVVTQGDEGYFLEMDGMKMFYPKSALSAAS